MARTPTAVSISLRELVQLLNYRWTAVNSSDIGELGTQVYEDLVEDLDRQSRIQIKPTQLADLIHHMKEVVFEKIYPVKVDITIKNHNKILRRLKSQAPELFKELPTGELVMVNYEERSDV